MGTTIVHQEQFSLKKPYTACEMSWLQVWERGETATPQRSEVSCLACRVLRAPLIPAGDFAPETITVRASEFHPEFLAKLRQEFQGRLGRFVVRRVLPADSISAGVVPYRGREPRGPTDLCSCSHKLLEHPYCCRCPCWEAATP